MGSDVAGSRPYRPGDDIDAIDWNASARLSSARDSDEFVVRERYAEEAPRVVLVCDRRPGMALFPGELPWLSKGAAMREAGGIIAESAIRARGLIGYLDYANVAHPDASQRAQEPFWRPPQSQSQLWRVKESHLRYPNFYAPEDTLTRALRHLTELRGGLPAGSFVFVLSDFLSPPAGDVWLTAISRRWDLVPVVIQDPVWEQSFPQVESVAVPVADPASGRTTYIRLNRRQALARKQANEERRARLLAGFRSLGIEPVCVSTSDGDSIFKAFLAWSQQRLYDRRRGW